MSTRCHGYFWNQASESAASNLSRAVQDLTDLAKGSCSGSTSRLRKYKLRTVSNINLLFSPRHKHLRVTALAQDFSSALQISLFEVAPTSSYLRAHLNSAAANERHEGAKRSEYEHAADQSGPVVPPPAAALSPWRRRAITKAGGGALPGWQRWLNVNLPSAPQT